MAICEGAPARQGLALRLQEALRKRLGKFGLPLEPSKTKLVEFGRFAQRHAPKRGRRRPETIYFLGFTRYCTRNRTGNFRVGMRTEKSRLQRSLSHLRDQMRRMRHLPVREQLINLNRVLRGHYAYYGIAGNFRALQQVHRFVERYWRKMRSSRSRKGRIIAQNAPGGSSSASPSRSPDLRRRPTRVVPRVRVLAGSGIGIVVPRELALVFHKWPWGPGGALTLGNTILHTGDTLDATCVTYAHRAGHCQEDPILLADHERAHVYQYMALGPLFLPLYLVSGGISVRNRFERAADRYAQTGRGWWPWA